MDIFVSLEVSESGDWLALFLGALIAKARYCGLFLNTQQKL